MDEIKTLANKIVSCKRCPRLINHITRVSLEKTKRFSEWNYWGKPIPGFGDLKARLLIIGLAPAAHGGNRTGRMFTGDPSGDWLIKALYHNGFANQPFSTNKMDGLKLSSVYITAVVRCAPPENKPNGDELANCSEYLKEELRIFRNVQVVVTLGRIAFRNYLKHFWTGVSKPRFKHGKIYKDNEGLILLASYHPSKQNTQTGKLTWDEWISIFKKVKKLLF